MFRKTTIVFIFWVALFQFCILCELPLPRDNEDAIDWNKRTGVYYRSMISRDLIFSQVVKCTKVENVHSVDEGMACNFIEYHPESKPDKIYSLFRRLANGRYKSDADKTGSGGKFLQSVMKATQEINYDALKEAISIVNNEFVFLSDREDWIAYVTCASTKPGNLDDQLLVLVYTRSMNPSDEEIQNIREKLDERGIHVGIHKTNCKEDDYY